MSPLQRVASWLQFTENQNGHHQGAGSKPGPATPWLLTCSPPTAHVFSASSAAWGTLTVPWAPWHCPADLAAWVWGVGESLPPRDRRTVSLSPWQVPLDLAGLPRAVVGELCRGQWPGTHPRWKLLNSPACPGWPRPCYLLCQKAAGSEHPGLQGASGIPARSL